MFTRFLSIWNKTCITELKSSSCGYMATLTTNTQAILVVAVALLAIYVSKKLLFKQQKNLPPGPIAWPIIGSLHLLGTHPHKSLADLASKYGPVMSVKLGQKLCVVATSPEASKEFLKLQDANFSSRPLLRAAELLLPKDLTFHDITPIMRHLRKILVTELMTTKRLDASKYMRTEEIAFMLRSIFKATGPVRISTLSNIMSLNIVSRMIFSRRFFGGDQSEEPASESVNDIKEFIDIVDSLAHCFAAVHPQDYFKFVPKWFDPQGLDARFRKLAARMDVFSRNMINQHKEERRKNPISDGEKTLLDALLEQLDNPELDVTEGHVSSVLWDALAGATETSSLTVEWAMAEVLRNPAFVKKARSELDRVVGLQRTVQEADIPELKFIQAIVKEALRLHTPLPLLVPHLNVTATKVFGYDIPAETTLYVNVWGIARDSSVWEKPLEFEPERFMDGAPHGVTEFQGQHYAFLPFGAGRRMCPAMAFASIAVHLEVASMLHAFDWSLPDGMALEHLDMSEGKGFALMRQNPLMAIATPRLPSHLY